MSPTLTCTLHSPTLQGPSDPLSLIDMSSFFYLNPWATGPQHHYSNHSYYYYCQQLYQTGHLHSSRSCSPIPLAMVHITSSTKITYATRVQHYVHRFLHTNTISTNMYLHTSKNTLMLFVAHLAMQQ